MRRRQIKSGGSFVFLLLPGAVQNQLLGQILETSASVTSEVADEVVGRMNDAGGNQRWMGTRGRVRRRKGARRRYVRTQKRRAIAAGSRIRNAESAETIGDSPEQLLRNCFDDDIADGARQKRIVWVNSQIHEISARRQVEEIHEAFDLALEDGVSGAGSESRRKRGVGRQRAGEESEAPGDVAGRIQRFIQGQEQTHGGGRSFLKRDSRLETQRQVRLERVDVPNERRHVTALKGGEQLWMNKRYKK